MNRIAATKYAKKLTAISINPRIEFRPMPMGDRISDDRFRVVQFLDGNPVGIA